MERVPKDVITLVLRTELRGHLSSHELPAIYTSCCLSVIRPRGSDLPLLGALLSPVARSGAQMCWGQEQHQGPGSPLCGLPRFHPSGSGEACRLGTD